MKKLYLYSAIILFFVFLIQGVVGISDYGINWDEPVHYIRGQAYLRYFLTGKDNYKDIPKLGFHYPKYLGSVLPSGVIANDDSVFRRSIYQYDSEPERLTYRWYLKNDAGHPPLNDISASFFNYLFYQKLGIMGDIESYHLFTILISSLLVSSIFLFTAYFFGFFAGFIAVLSLILYPIFFSESHFNIKDPVEASFYTWTIIAFYLGIIRRNWKWLICCAVLSGLALGTKFNILFSVFSIIPWIVIYKWKEFSRFKWPFAKSITISLIALPIIAFAILVGSWPYLWTDSLSHLSFIISYYKTIGSMSYQVKDHIIFYGLNTYALQWILYTTPLVTLFFTLIGLLYTFTKGLKEKEKTALFVFLWFLIPIARVSVPNAGIYGGVRQIMEYIPPMAILAGIGASYIVKQFQQWSNRIIKQSNSKRLVLILQTLFILAFLPITFKLISIHPNENVYFNPLIGGLKGAKERNFPDWGTTLGSVYQQGMFWLNTNAEHGANVTLIKGLLSNIPRVKIRNDINFYPYDKYYSADEKKGEYLMEVTDYRWNIDIPKDKRKYLETLIPVYEVKVDDVAILKIWKNDKQHSKIIGY